MLLDRGFDAVASNDPEMALAVSSPNAPGS